MKKQRIVHLMRGQFLRLKWEIIALWVVSITISLFAIFGIAKLSSVSLGWLEVTLAGWLGLRLALAESGFGIHAGWQARPFLRSEPLAAQLALLVLVFAPVLALRAFCVESVLAPSGAGWWKILVSTWLPALGAFLLVFTIVALFSERLVHKTGTLSSPSMFRMVVCLLGIAFFTQHFAKLRQSGNHSGSSPSDLTAMLRSDLPDDRTLLGEGGLAIPSETGAKLLKELLRLPLRKGARHIGASDISGQILWIAPQGNRLELSLQLDSCVRQLPHKDELLLAVRYSDGSYGPRKEYSSVRDHQSIPLLPLNRQVEWGSFYSPKSQPATESGWGELLVGAELIVYTPTQRPYLIKKNQRPMLLSSKLPPFPHEDDPELIRDYVDNVVQHLNDAQLRNFPPEMGAREIPALLECHAWSKKQWQGNYRDFIKKHANESHLPLLLDRLKHDPNIAEVMVDHGDLWFEQALPTIAEHLIAGRPIPDSVLARVVKLNDPKLAGALQDQLIRSESEISSIIQYAPMLREHPGCDWSRTISRAWKLRKYGVVGRRNTDIFASWAAELGDVSALRFLAERAAGRLGESEVRLQRILGELIPADADPLLWIGEHFDRLEFEDGTYRIRS